MVAGVAARTKRQPGSLPIEIHGNFARLIDAVAKHQSTTWSGRFRAGADAVQIFDTWSGVLSPEEFERWCIGPIGPDRRPGPGPSSGSEDHRLSTRSRDVAPPLRRAGTGQRDQSRLDGRSSLTHATFSRISQFKVISIRTPCGRAARRWIVLSMPFSRLSRWSIHLQPGPRHFTGYPHFPRRADARTGARPLNVRLGKSLSHHCGNRLDGGHALPAAAVRLSLRRRTRAACSPRPSRSWNADCSRRS